MAVPQDRAAATGPLRVTAASYAPLRNGAGGSSSPSELLLPELIAFLEQRQSATRAQVSEHSRQTGRRVAATERRFVEIEQRLERLERRLDRFAEQVQGLRATNRALREMAPVRQPANTTAPVSQEQRAPTPAPQQRRSAVPILEPYTAGATLLRVENLSKEIGGSDILMDINFEIHEQEILGLIGPNGAGKTTLMECLAGLRPRTSGIFYQGEEAPPDWDPRHLMFYLPNGVSPYAEFYTIEVLTFFGRLYEVDPTRWERIIVEELALVPVLQKKVSALSKGNLQRLLIALALMSPQPLLALDEPFDGLDIHQTHAMMGILRDLRAQKRTLLLCIHQLSDAERICDRLLLLSTGRMVGMGTLAELREQAGLDASSNLEDIFLALTGNRARPMAATLP
jgi:ABC-2 type transport system ATP-binding protein